MRSNLQRYFLLGLVIFVIACKPTKETEKLSVLSNQLNDSVYVWEKSKLRYADQYHSYLLATSKDTSIHTTKALENTYYPWKVNLDKESAASFLLYLEKNLAAEKDYKSAFGELPSIGAEYIPSERNFIMADLLTCKLSKYNLTNSKGQKITIDEEDVSINKNVGAINFTLAKWDLQGQKIKGEVTLDITLPYHIYNINLKPVDGAKTFDFGTTKINVLRFENNVLHYAVEDDLGYSTDILVDSCMSSKNRISFPRYFYNKLIARPNLSYKQFINDSTYFELGKKWKKDSKRVRVVYFESCDPGIIYLYGYQRTEVLKKSITIPIDAIVN
ncbi:hypothetical protein [Pedobacter duraquae]|uniref:Uncharacterized protein n=1 Tax=Pedobacter duraquae TaxID=425511 RepID=A0A4R6INP2_9SPHI|nr:hypothetical protein [Pedobacter duraquae]TDO23884.1 hypothetical protein CLV32_0170 [Pedobacter duraquae]